MTQFCQGGVNTKEKGEGGDTTAARSLTLAEATLLLASEAHADHQQREGEDQAHKEHRPSLLSSLSCLSAKKGGGCQTTRHRPCIGVARHNLHNTSSGGRLLPTAGEAAKLFIACDLLL